MEDGENESQAEPGFRTPWFAVVFFRARAAGPTGRERKPEPVEPGLNRRRCVLGCLRSQHFNADRREEHERHHDRERDGDEREPHGLRRRRGLRLLRHFDRADHRVADLLDDGRRRANGLDADVAVLVHDDQRDRPNAHSAACA